MFSLLKFQVDRSEMFRVSKVVYLDVSRHPALSSRAVSGDLGQESAFCFYQIGSPCKGFLFCLRQYAEIGQHNSYSRRNKAHI